VAVDDAELFLHMKRMSRLTRAMKAPLDTWEAEVLQRIRRRYGEACARVIRMQLDEAFIELVTTIDQGITN
jgi:hypothetical protein